MSTIELRKRSDAGQRWVAHWIWVQEGYWQPDPVDPDPDIPDDPIDEEPQVIGYFVNYKSWPTIPWQTIYGIIPSGYVLRYQIIPDQNGGAPTYFYWYEPA